MNIDSCLDWLSFSVMFPTPDCGVERGVYSMVNIQWPMLRIVDQPTTQGRKPYTHSFRLSVGGRVYYNPDNELVNHYLVEIEGRGCRRLYNSGALWPFADGVLKHAWNITRCDLAVDLETDTRPDQFAKHRSARFKTSGEVITQSGHTCYVGSQRGDKYARVYRYNPPHERSHLLRIEMVYKKKSAREALLHFLNNDPLLTAAVAGNTYAWSHPDWDFSAPGKIKGWYEKQGKESTLWWLRKQVLPALKNIDLDSDHPFWKELAAVVMSRVDH